MRSFHITILHNLLRLSRENPYVEKILHTNRQSSATNQHMYIRIKNTKIKIMFNPKSRLHLWWKKIQIKSTYYPPPQNGRNRREICLFFRPNMSVYWTLNVEHKTTLWIKWVDLRKSHQFEVRTLLNLFCFFFLHTFHLIWTCLQCVHLHICCEDIYKRKNDSVPGFHSYSNLYATQFYSIQKDSIWWWKWFVLDRKV